MLYLEQDVTKIDKYDRTLAYLWFEVDGQPYLLNHVLINNGWAEDVDYGDHLYDDELTQAAAFAKRHDLGAWGLCGGFGVPLADEPAQEASSGNGGGGSASGGGGAGNYVPPAQPEPAYEEPAPAPANNGCDPNYSGCVPMVNYDLDCGDIGFAVQVLGSDHHRFDGDGDGWGCESYG